MTRRNQRQDIGSEMVLIGLIAVACIAGIPPIVDVVVQAFAQSKTDATRACRACGVVEDVRSVTLEGAQYGVSTVNGEGFAMFFALLRGKLANTPVQIYETEVLLQDGSVRVIRESTPPAWKPGDQVKVVMGRVKPV